VLAQNREAGTIPRQVVVGWDYFSSHQGPIPGTGGSWIQQGHHEQGNLFLWRLSIERYRERSAILALSAIFLPVRDFVNNSVNSSPTVHPNI
jgi:hypothetical protein